MSDNKIPSRHRIPKHRKTSSLDTSEIVKLIRAGVERFVLKDAPIGDFRRAIRKAAEEGEISSHPLTGTIFRQIVKAALKERKKRVGRTGTVSSKTKRKRNNA